jgi:hypothetical protein
MSKLHVVPHVQPVERKPRRTAPLVIPRGLQKELPFKLTPKNQAAQDAETKRIPVVLEPKEAKVCLPIIFVLMFIL